MSKTQSTDAKQKTECVQTFEYIVVVKIILCVTVTKMLNDTDTDTFFGIKFFRYWSRDIFPVPNFSDTTRKMKNSRYRHLNGTGTHYKSSKFLNFGNENQFRYQIFPIPVPRLFSGTKFCRYRFRDFFPVPNFSDTGSETFSRYQFFPIPVPRLFHGTKFFRYRFRDFFPVPICSDTGSDTTKKMKNSRYREFPVPVRHTLIEGIFPAFSLTFFMEI